MAYFGDFCQATTTSAGTGNVTLAAVANWFLPSNAEVGLLVGDQAVFSFQDANGGKEVSLCTLVSTAPDVLSRDTCYASSNANSKINLSGGATTVLLVVCATDLGKRYVAGDAFIDYVVSGLALPTTAAGLTGSISAGVAYAIGQRVVKGAQSNTYTASKDTYVDLSNIGVYTYSAVANSAAAPALTANSVRLGFVTTDGTHITGATTTGKDSLGNWMRNTLHSPSCRLFSTATIATNAAATYSFNLAAYEVSDNDAMHSISVNPTRITINHAGKYAVTWFCEGISLAVAQLINNGVKINGSLNASSQVGAYGSVGSYPCLSGSDQLILAAGDFLELQFSTQTSSESFTNFTLCANRIG